MGALHHPFGPHTVVLLLCCLTQILSTVYSSITKEDSLPHFMASLSSLSMYTRCSKLVAISHFLTFSSIGTKPGIAYSCLLLRWDRVHAEFLRFHAKFQMPFGVFPCIILSSSFPKQTTKSIYHQQGKTPALWGSSNNNNRKPSCF